MKILMRVYTALIILLWVLLLVSIVLVELGLIRHPEVVLVNFILALLNTMLFIMVIDMD